MQIENNANLKSFHTFGIEQHCAHLAIIESVEDLKSIVTDKAYQTLPRLFLGKGSNVLFVAPYSGVVIVNRLLGKTVTETPDYYHLHIEGGEDWPSLVKWSVEQGIGGLENLALIPGCAGSAPIQNIGAYGVEFKDLCEYVDVVDLDSFVETRMTLEECEFGYRDSIFKHALHNKCFIKSIGLKLPKAWKAVNQYGPLQAIPDQELSPRRIFDEVCAVRMSKLPDPTVVGNAGSFFKNPVISKDQFDRLKSQFPEMIAYPAAEGMKLAAGWLIDQCGLKGFSVNGAQVNPMQALVLTNADNCTSQDVVKLASAVKSRVWDKYQVELEHEVRFIGSDGETTLTELEGVK